MEYFILILRWYNTKYSQFLKSRVGYVMYGIVSGMRVLYFKSQISSESSRAVLTDDN